MKRNEPKLTQKEISKHLGFSDSTIKRYRDDVNMDSPYNKKILIKNTQSNTSITESQTHTPSENAKNEKSTKSIKKYNILKSESILEDECGKSIYDALARKVIDNIK